MCRIDAHIGGLMSFSGYLLNVGAKSPYLNPPNRGQGVVNTYLGKPVRFIGRAGWGLGAYSIGALCGAAYNSFQAARFCRSDKKLAAAHFNMAWRECKRVAWVAATVACIAMSCFYNLKTVQSMRSTAMAMRNNVSYAQVMQMKNTLHWNTIIWVASTGTAALLMNMNSHLDNICLFTGDPDVFIRS